jgi:hypothetical protein
MDNEVEIWLVLAAFLAATGGLLFWDAQVPRRFSLRSFLIAMAFAAVVIALVAAYARTVFTNT